MSRQDCKKLFQAEKVVAFKEPVYDAPYILENHIPYDEYAKYEKTGIPKRFRRITWDHIRELSKGAERKRLEILKQAKEYSDNLPKYVKTGTGLLLKGTVGTGKTTVALAILRDHIERGGNGYFITAVNLMDKIFSIQDYNERSKFEKKLKTTAVLVLDDLGAEGAGDMVSAKIDAIISERYNNEKLTIITTNLGNEDLKRIYDERMYDRLRETCKVLMLTGQSLRANAE